MSDIDIVYELYRPDDEDCEDMSDLPAPYSIKVEKVSAPPGKLYSVKQEGHKIVCRTKEGETYFVIPLAVLKIDPSRVLSVYGRPHVTASDDVIDDEPEKLEVIVHETYVQLHSRKYSDFTLIINLVGDDDEE